jgi:hypothetical protein
MLYKVYMSGEINRQTEIVPWPEDQWELHVCPSPDCCGGMVQPERWVQADDRGSWRLWTFCGECLTHYVGVFGEKQIDDYDKVLDAQTNEMQSVLKKIEREDMENFVGTFSAALEADIIGPEDF